MSNILCGIRLHTKTAFSDFFFVYVGYTKKAQSLNKNEHTNGSQDGQKS